MDVVCQVDFDCRAATNHVAIGKPLVMNRNCYLLKYSTGYFVAAIILRTDSF